MTSSVSLQAKAHQFLPDKYSGNTTESFTSIINSTLQQSGIQVDFEDKRKSREALQAFLNLVDFKTIFVDTLNNLLIDKWSATNETWRIWVNNYGLTDFRETAVTAVGIVRQPKLVLPRAEYGLTELNGEQISAKLETYGDMIQLYRDAIFNDDISAINTFLSGIAGAYDRQIGDKVYAFLKDNPVAFNDKEIFHEEHNNMVTQTSGFADDLGAAIELMSGQKITLYDNSVDSVRVQPKYILVPASKAMAAASVVADYNDAVLEQQRLTIVVESRLNGFNGWFLACDNPFASISLFTLRERTIPEIFTNAIFNTDGIQVKHRMDYDIKPIDYRGLVRVM